MDPKSTHKAKEFIGHAIFQSYFRFVSTRGVAGRRIKTAENRLSLDLHSNFFMIEANSARI